MANLKYMHIGIKLCLSFPSKKKKQTLTEEFSLVIYDIVIQKEKLCVKWPHFLACTYIYIHILFRNNLISYKVMV